MTDRLSSHTGPRTSDSLLLAAVVALSALPYLTGLGFYSDDWIQLSAMVHCSAQSWTAVLACARGVTEATRPIYGAVLGTEYWLFGLRPLGYHLLNHATLIAAVVLLYRVILVLGWPRVVAVGTALVFALLPNYSTDRFWIAALHGNLSIALFLLSALADINAVRGPQERFWTWRCVGLLALAGSVLTYELTLPLLLLTSALVWLIPHLIDSPVGERMRPRASIIAFMNVAALAAFVLFVTLATPRSLMNGNFIGHGLGVIKGALIVHAGRLGVALPYTAALALADDQRIAHLAVAAAIALGCFFYVHRLAATGASALGQTGAPFAATLGVIVFSTAYALAFVTPEIAFSVAGIANRTAIGAAMGIALFVTGVAARASLRLRQPAASYLFAACVSLICLCGVVITSATASHWVSAYTRQQAIVADIRQHVPSLPAGSTILLDGVCSYDGPAIVFESNWDLAGSLRIAYGDPGLKADVVSPLLDVSDTAVTTLLYGHLFAAYPFGESLVVYDYRRKALARLPTAAAAQAYFAPRDRSNGCPAGTAGEGVRLY